MSHSHIIHPPDLHIPSEGKEILTQIFANDKIHIEKQFTAGHMAHVFMIHVTNEQNDITRLPYIFKLAPKNLIDQEWHVFQTYINDVFPMAASIKYEPVYDKHNWWGGLIYELIGQGVSEIHSLHHHLEQHAYQQVQQSLTQLFTRTNIFWKKKRKANTTFYFRHTYDWVLPHHLTVELNQSDIPTKTQALNMQSQLPLSINTEEWVTIENAVVYKVNKKQKTVVLHIRDDDAILPKIIVLLKNVQLPQFFVLGKPVAFPISGIVIDTRHDWFQREIANFIPHYTHASNELTLPKEQKLPNPIHHLTRLLDTRYPVDFTLIHGDLNLQNIIAEQPDQQSIKVQLIDFALTREDHILHDFLRLESELIVKIVPSLLKDNPIQGIVTLYRHLYDPQHTPLPNILKNILQTLHHIRQEAQQYLLKTNDWEEYSTGLIIYLLGTLRFKNRDEYLNIIQKKIAFYGAATILDMIKQPIAPFPPMPISSETSQVKFGEQILILEGKTTTTIPKLGERLTTTPPPFLPPKLPPHGIFGRDELLANIVEKLQLENTDATSIPPVALRGMGGIGKTTSAIALGRLPFINQHFPDGVLWVALGRNPTIRILLDKWGRALGVDLLAEPNEEACKTRLANVLHYRRVLLLVDDVWETEHGQYFMVAGPHCRTLITTRETNVAYKLANRPRTIPVDVLSPEASLALLAHLVPEVMQQETTRKDALQLCERIEYLPLAITLVGNLLAEAANVPSYMERLISEYIDRRKDTLQLIHPERLGGEQQKQVSVETILAMSVERLQREEDRERFIMAGVFGGDPLTWSLDAAAGIWQCSKEEAEETTLRLINRGLIDIRGDKYWMHALLAEYANKLIDQMNL